MATMTGNDVIEMLENEKRFAQLGALNEEALYWHYRAQGKDQFAVDAAQRLAVYDSWVLRMQQLIDGIREMPEGEDGADDDN